jgi:hypothetical protein
MLVHAHEGSKFQLPQLQAPFEKDAVAHAIGVSGLTVRVSVEPSTGRWGSAIGRKIREEKFERAQHQKLREAQQATLLKHSSDPLESDRASLMLRKHQVDDDLRKAKVALGQAKAKAFKHRIFLDPMAYRKLEANVEELKQESQGIQVTLGQLRKQEVSKKPGFDLGNKRFRDFAHKILSDELFSEIQALTESDVDPYTFEPDYSDNED